MLSSVEKAFVGRDEIQAPLKMLAWEARSTPASLPPVTVKWAITRGGCLGEVSTIGLGLGNFSVLNSWLIIRGGCL